MKTMRRYFAMLLTLIMSFSLVTSAAAAETKTVVVGDVSIDFGVEETTVMPRGVWAFWDECNGKNNYSNSFTCYPGNGNNLELTVVNSGNNDVIVNLDVDGTAVPAWKIPAGETDSAEIRSTDQSEGLTCDVSINITTTNGANMNVQIKAWQYQVNP